MKHYGFLVLFLMGISFHLHAQNVRLDIQAGPNFSTLSTPSTNDFESEVEFGNHVGIAGAIKISEVVELYGGLSLSEVNFNRTYTTDMLGANDEYPEEIELSYGFKTIGIPVGARYLVQGGLVDLGFSAGLRPVFTSGYDGERFSNENAIQQQFDLSDEIKDMGLFVEPGFKLGYALDENTQVFTGFRYGFDILGVYQSGEESRRLHRFDVEVGLSIALF